MVLQVQTGCVTALATLDAVVLSTQLLGSITVSQMLPGRLPPLQRCSVDRSGIFAQAALPLSETEFFLSAHPIGLVMLKR